MLAAAKQSVQCMQFVCMQISGGGRGGADFRGRLSRLFIHKENRHEETFFQPSLENPPKKHHTNFSDSVRIVYIPYWSWKVSIIPNTHHPSRIWAI